MVNLEWISVPPDSVQENQTIIDEKEYDGYAVVPFEFLYNCSRNDATYFVQSMQNVIFSVCRENNIDVYVVNNPLNFTEIKCGEIEITIKTHFNEESEIVRLLNISSSDKFTDQIVKNYNNLTNMYLFKQ